MPKKYWYYSFLSGVLLSLPGYDVFPGVILCVALVPLLLAENFISDYKQHFSSGLLFLLASVTFFTWNIMSLWWVIKISVTAAMLIISINSVAYAFVFWLFHVIKRSHGMQTGRIAFIVLWIALEYCSLHTELLIPWLVLGNGLANQPAIIQWFEFTGVLGGSLWILLTNLVVFELVRLYKLKKIISVKYLLNIGLILFFVPILISLFFFRDINESGESCKVVIVQPNIDPFNEKFSALTQAEQLQRMLSLADSAKTENVDYYLAPETAIDNDIWEGALMNNYSLFLVRNFIEQHSNSVMFFGAITYQEYLKEDDKTSTVRYDNAEMRYYDVFNSALQVDTSFSVQIYHKSKLVLGAEKVPFPKIFRFFDTYLVNLGGITGSLGEQEDRTVFKCLGKPYVVAPVICYESVFGEYVADYIKKGANLLFVITNDGWWGGTMGYTQHLRFSQLRAIETRRSIARCANTGISAFINERGEIIKATGWWQQTALSGSIRTNNTVTFYTQHGDYIGRVAVFFSVCILLIGLSKRIVRLKFVL